MIGLARKSIVVAALLASTSAFAAGGWTVSEASGNVTITRGDKVLNARKDSAVRAGDVVRTGTGSRAVLVRGKEYVVVSPKAHIRIAEPEKAGPVTQIFQYLGNVLFKIEKKSTPHFGVETPYMAAVVKGTTFNVSVSERGTSVQVTEGAVEVMTSDELEAALLTPGLIGLVEAGSSGELTVITSDEAASRKGAAVRGTPRFLAKMPAAPAGQVAGGITSPSGNGAGGNGGASGEPSIQLASLDTPTGGTSANSSGDDWNGSNDAGENAGNDADQDFEGEDTGEDIGDTAEFLDDVVADGGEDQGADDQGGDDDGNGDDDRQDDDGDDDTDIDLGQGNNGNAFGQGNGNGNGGGNNGNGNGNGGSNNGSGGDDDSDDDTDIDVGQGNGSGNNGNGNNGNAFGQGNGNGGGNGNGNNGNGNGNGGSLDNAFGPGNSGGNGSGNNRAGDDDGDISIDVGLDLGLDSGGGEGSGDDGQGDDRDDDDDDRDDGEAGNGNNGNGNGRGRGRGRGKD